MLSSNRIQNLRYYEDDSEVRYRMVIINTLEKSIKVLEQGVNERQSHMLDRLGEWEVLLKETKGCLDICYKDLEKIVDGLKNNKWNYDFETEEIM